MATHRFLAGGMREKEHKTFACYNGQDYVNKEVYHKAISQFQFFTLSI